MNAFGLGEVNLMKQNAISQGKALRPLAAISKARHLTVLWIVQAMYGNGAMIGLRKTIINLLLPPIRVDQSVENIMLSAVGHGTAAGGVHAVCVSQLGSVITLPAIRLDFVWYANNYIIQRK